MDLATLALLAATMLVAAPSSARSLQTRATVVVVEVATADLDWQDPAVGAVWSLAGAPDEQIHVMWQWRTLDGAWRARPAANILRLDGAGRAAIAADLSPDTPGALAPDGALPLVMTLVVCRE